MLTQKLLHPYKVIPSSEFRTDILEVTYLPKSQMCMKPHTVLRKVRILLPFMWPRYTCLEAYNPHLFQRRLQSFIQTPSKPCLPLFTVDINRALHSPGACCSYVKGSSIGIAYYFAALLRHQIRIFFADVYDTMLKILHRWHIVLKGNSSIPDIWRVYCQKHLCILRYCIANNYFCQKTPSNQINIRKKYCRRCNYASPAVPDFTSHSIHGPADAEQPAALHRPQDIPECSGRFLPTRLLFLFF